MAQRFDATKAKLETVTGQIKDKETQRATIETFPADLHKQDGLVTEFDPLPYIMKNLRYLNTLLLTPFWNTLYVYIALLDLIDRSIQDAGGDLIEERIFRGPLPQQIRNTLEYLNSLGGTLIQKIRGQAEIERTVPYPYEAMEEAIVNAVYHRGYDGPPEPVKVYLYPDRMEITSYPGPVAGLQNKHFEPGQNIPQVPARNRRIGEFLKELRLAEARGTGIPKIQRKMRENGSPAAQFDFDEQRTYFRVILPVHPRYQVLHALREAAHLWAVGEKANAISHLERAFERQPASGSLAGQLIEYSFGAEKSELANKTLSKFKQG